MQGWGHQWEEDCGKECQRVVYLLAANHGPPPGAGAFRRRVLSVVSPPPLLRLRWIQAPLHPSHSPALPAAQSGVRMEHASAMLGLLQGAETASLGW